MDEVVDPPVAQGDVIIGTGGEMDTPVAVARTAPLTAAQSRTLTVGLLLIATIVAFESLAVSTVMPLVEKDLGDLWLYGWVFSAFFLGSLVGTVVVGGLLDRGSLVVSLLAGLGLFAVGLTLGGLTPSMPVLVGARVLQGLGGGALSPVLYVAIGRSFDEMDRPRMFFLLSVAWVVPGIVGPAIAGLIGQALTWRAVFLGLLPFIALAAVITIPALAHVPGAPAAGGSSASTLRRLRAAVLLALGAALVVAGLTVGLTPASVLLVLAGGLIALPSIRRLSPPATLRLARGLPAAVGLRGVLTFAFFMADAYVPLLLVDWRGATAAEAGVVLTAATLAWALGAWLQARAVVERGVARLVGAGFLVVAIGVGTTLLVLVPAVPWAVSVLTWGLAGLGMGLAYAPLSLAVLSDAPAESVGAASSALQVWDLLGTALGTGLAGAMVAAGARAGLEAWVGLGAAFGVGTAVALFGGATASRLTVRPVAASGPGLPLR